MSLFEYNKIKPKFQVGDVIADANNTYYCITEVYINISASKVIRYGCLPVAFRGTTLVHHVGVRGYNESDLTGFSKVIARKKQETEDVEVIYPNKISAIELWGYLKDFCLDTTFKHTLCAKLHIRTMYIFTGTSLENFVKACRDIKRETRKARKDAEKQARTEKRIRKHKQKMQESINRICAECKVSEAELYEYVKKHK